MKRAVFFFVLHPKADTGACSDQFSLSFFCVQWVLLLYHQIFPGEPRAQGSAVWLLYEVCSLPSPRASVHGGQPRNFLLPGWALGLTSSGKVAKPWVHSIPLILISLTPEQNFALASMESLLINSSTNRNRSWSANVELFIVSSAGLSKILSIFDLWHHWLWKPRGDILQLKCKFPEMTWNVNSSTILPPSPRDLLL